MSRPGTARRILTRRKLGNPREFSPRDLPGLVLWLRSDMGITLAGSKVSAWADQSGTGYDFSQATDSFRPVYTTSNASMGNKPSLTFTSSTTGLERADVFLGYANVTVSVTYRKSVDAGAPRVFGVPSASGGNFNFISNSGLGLDVTQVNTGTNAVRSTPDGINVNWNRIAAVPCSTASTVDPTVYSQGVAGGSVISSTSVDGTVGAGTWNIGYILNGDITEVIAYNRLITAQEAASIYAYQLARYGV